MHGGWAILGAWHAVAGIHPQEGLMIGHACGPWEERNES